MFQTDGWDQKRVIIGDQPRVRTTLRMPPKDSTKLERKLSPSDTNSLLFSGHGTTFQTPTHSSRSRHSAQQYRTEFKQTQNDCSIPVM